MSLAEELFDTEEAEKQKPPRYIVRNAAYALSPHPPIDYVIERLVHEKSVTMLYGEPGSKKTWILLSLAVNVALGKAWLGLQTQPRKVLFVDEEAGEEWMTKRLASAIHGELADEHTPVEFVSLAGFHVDDKKDAAELEQLIVDRQAGLVIIDALSDIMVGDENSKQDTQPVFNTLKQIASRTGAAIILIHHSNKTGGYRGSSAIKGALDNMLKIETEEGSAWVNIKSEKTRNVKDLKLTAVCNWSEDDSQFYMELAENGPKGKKISNSQAYVIRYLTEHATAELQQIMGAADMCSPNAARHATYDLVKDGTVYRTNSDETGRGVNAVYALKESIQMAPVPFDARVPDD